MDRPSCGSCPYWREVPRDGHGECVLNPPTIVSHELFSLDSCDDWDLSAARALPSQERRDYFVMDATRFPITFPEEYCGQHPGFPAWIEFNKTSTSKE